MLELLLSLELVHNKVHSCDNKFMVTSVYGTSIGTGVIQETLAAGSAQDVVFLGVVGPGQSGLFSACPGGDMTGRVSKSAVRYKQVIGHAKVHKSPSVHIPPTN